MGLLRDDLLAHADDVRETHISWVFLSGGDVYKVKKPVALGFLDFSSLEARRLACEAEVTLNRRIEPDVYLGVVPVTRDASGNHNIGGADEIVDHAVHMRRLADADRLDVRLERGTLTDATLARLAARIARFHERADTDARIASFGSVDAIRINVEENFAQTRESVLGHVSESEAAEIEEWQLRFLEERAALFQERRRTGHVRDCHGDLRLEQIYETDAGDVHVLDCIEFNERFRYGDTCSDVAFLSMDLASRGRTDLAERFLALYARESNDFDLYPLVDFYESYRAFVRAKVATMLAADTGAPDATRKRAASEARRHFLLSVAAKRRPLLPPRVIAVGGLIASGKSTIADALSSELGAPVVETDRTRKHMVGARPTDKLYDGAFRGAYDPAFTVRVYDEVYRRAGRVLESGRPVVLDASFRTPKMRDRAKQLALTRGVPFTMIECTTPLETSRARLVERARRGPSVSDGRLEIFDDFVASYAPVAEGELAEGEHVTVRTDRPVSECLRELRSRLPTWDGLAG